MLLVTLALKTFVSISQNGLTPITLNKQVDNQLNKHDMNASTSLDQLLFILKILLIFITK